MIVINQEACSKEFLLALDAVHAGKTIRRESWPEAQFLRKHNNETIAVFRNGVLSSPVWNGPRGDELDSSDWLVVG